MKKALTILTILTICFSWQLSAQEYQVLHVKGEIIRTESGEALKAGDKVAEDEEIHFKTVDAMAAVLDPGMGRYILKPESKEAGEGDLIYVLKSTVTPVRGGMSTRAAGINSAFDMQVYFAETTFVWPGNVIALRISEAVFPMDEENFFFLRYSWQSDQINRKLEFNKNTLLMNKNEVFEVDGKKIDPHGVSDFELYYYQSENEESALITAIDFVLISQEDLQSVYKAFKDNSKYPFNDVADLFSDLYGKCDPVQVRYNIMTQ